MRECGSCIWCCFFPAIPESPANELCPFCIVGKGCSIYETRGKGCRDFSCLWWRQTQIPENLRPDKCGVMFELPDYCHTYIGYVDPNKPESYKTEEVRVLIQKIVESGNPVLIYRGPEKGKIFFLPKGLTVDAVREDIRTAIEARKSAA